jgi:SpoVK/Ycf46/Vps4 family AAA+-type ATPase
MPALEIDADTIEVKKMEVRDRLNSSGYNLQNLVEDYEKSTGKSGKAPYNAVINAFAHQAAVHGLLLRELRGEDKLVQSNAYSMHVCSVYGSEQFSGLEEVTLKTRGFFDGCKVDVVSTVPNIATKFMEFYSEAVKMCANSGDFDLDSVTAQYFQWMYNEVQQHREDKFILELQMFLNKNPIVIKEKSGAERKFKGMVEAVSESDSKEYSWDMIGGYENEKRICQRLVETIRNYEAMQRRMEDAIPKGILFHGPPGTGKTTFAKIIAQEAGVPFEYISRKEMVSTFKDGTPEKLGEVYTRAKSYIRQGLAPAAIVFIDEADSLVAKRDGRDREHSNETTVFLTETDGNHVPGVITMAATNRADILDPAASRRFEEKVHIGLPDLTAKKAIYRVVLDERAAYALKHNGEENFLGNIDYKKLAQASEGFAGAHIRIAVKKAVREQTLDIVVNGKETVPLATEDLLEAIKEVKGKGMDLGED